MKEDLDRLLEGLGKVEAPGGLEQRVLRRLETSDAPRRQPVWAWAIAAAVLLASIAAGRNMLQPAVVAPEHRAEVKLPQESVKPLLTDATPHTRPKARAVAAPHPVGVEIGFSAPEAPLSEQEILLLRLARRPTPGTLAMFDERIQRQRSEADKAELDVLNPTQPLVGPRLDENKLFAAETKENHDDDVYAKR